MTALILSAGASSRMGLPKALLRFPSGLTLLEDQCLRLKEVGVQKIFVVVGFEAETIVHAHSHLNVTWVENKDWALGNFSSILYGIKKIGSVPIILLPIDVVGVDSCIIQKIVAEGMCSNTNVVPTFSGKGGHPVFLCLETVRIIIDQSFREGRLDQILRESQNIKRIEVGSPSILNNVNTPEDWMRVIGKKGHI